MAKIEFDGNEMDVVPVRDRVLVRHYTVAAVSKGGLVIPATARQTEKLAGTRGANGLLPLAEVVEVGPDVKGVEVGDVVLVEEGGQGVRLGGVFVLYEVGRLLGVVGDVEGEDGIDFR